VSKHTTEDKETYRQAERPGQNRFGPPLYPGIPMSMNSYELEEKLRLREEDLAAARQRREAKDASKQIEAFFETAR
jgi:hypothetical protein